MFSQSRLDSVENVTLTVLDFRRHSEMQCVWSSEYVRKHLLYKTKDMALPLSVIFTKACTSNLVFSINFR